MASFDEFTPLLQETLDNIRARLDADVNAGVLPNDESFIDTTVGGFYWDLSQTVALEIERLWDYLGTEVPAASLLAFSWGEYLDQHGVLLGLARKEATRATGEVTFTGEAETKIPSGVQVAVPQTDPDSDEEVTFETTEAGTIEVEELTLPIQAVNTGTAGNVAKGAVSLLLTPLEGITAVTNADATSGGFDVESDEAFRDRLIREAGAPPAAGNVADYERWALEYPGVGYAVINPVWEGAGTVQVILTDYDNRPVPTAVEEAVQAELDPFYAETKTKAKYEEGETLEVESTTDFREASVASPQRININDQIATYTGKEAAKFTGVKSLTGPIESGTYVYQGGRGEGKAPIGADVTVDTPTLVEVTVEGELEFEDGYSVSGAGGTTDLTETLTGRITEYIDFLPAGEDVRVKHVEAQCFKVAGVRDIKSMKLNGGAANVTITSSPPQSAITKEVKLT